MVYAIRSLFYIKIAVLWITIDKYKKKDNTRFIETNL